MQQKNRETYDITNSDKVGTHCKICTWIFIIKDNEEDNEDEKGKITVKKQL